MDFSQLDLFILAMGAMGCGIYLLIKSGDWIIESSVFVARRFAVPPLIVGFTIVAFGTSLPELVVSVLSNLAGAPGIAIGNVLGSNIANICLVIGATAAVAAIHTTFKDVARDLGFMLLATFLLTAILMIGEISRWAGFSMVAVLLIYVFIQYRTSSEDDLPEEVVQTHEYSYKFEPYAYLLLGVATIYIGAEFLVRGAQVSASIVGVPESVIGVSVIALGTSLPELSTCLIAARRGHSDIVLGNIIGSNVFNILMILGVASLVKPMAQGEFAARLGEFDIWVVLGISLIFAGLLAVFNKISRPVGVVLILTYVAYNIYIYYQYFGNGYPVAGS